MSRHMNQKAGLHREAVKSSDINQKPSTSPPPQKYDTNQHGRGVVHVLCVWRDIRDTYLLRDIDPVAFDFHLTISNLLP